MRCGFPALLGQNVRKTRVLTNLSARFAYPGKIMLHLTRPAHALVNDVASAGTKLPLADITKGPYHKLVIRLQTLSV